MCKAIHIMKKSVGVDGVQYILIFCKLPKDYIGVVVLCVIVVARKMDVAILCGFICYIKRAVF